MSKILEVVIKIPKGDYDYIMHRANAVDEDLDFHETLISYGTVLPKGHGSLIDADTVLDFMRDTLDMQEVYLPIHFKELVIDEIPTILEAEVENESQDKSK